MKFAFIEEHRPMWRLARMCTVLKVSRTGYFAYRAALSANGMVASMSRRACCYDIYTNVLGLR